MFDIYQNNLLIRSWHKHVKQATWDGPYGSFFPFAVGCISIDQLILAVFIIHSWSLKELVNYFSDSFPQT